MAALVRRCYPESANVKGDHLVGDCYVAFDKNYKAELKALKEQGMTDEEAEAASTVMADARAMLRKWEDGDADVRALWSKMNEWVYAGFDETYKRMGVGFDKIYYESQTYLDGKAKGARRTRKKVFSIAARTARYGLTCARMVSTKSCCS